MDNTIGKAATQKDDDGLTRYRAKRRFDETPEPKGALSAKAAPGARYLIQKHDATRLHYDFRLELNGVLLSWAVTRGPSYSLKDKRLAVRTEDHPLEYGKFEGTIPKGNYGGGTVMLWDTGTWEPLGSAEDGLRDGKLAFILHGERLRGKWALVRMRPRAKEKNENWLLIKEKDERANTHPDLLEQAETSVVSGRAMQDIAAGDAVWESRPKSTRLPPFAKPMLATLWDTAPAGEDWIFEIKYDGYRALIAADGSAVKIYTRSGLDWTARFPNIAQAVAALNLPATLLDSEITVLDTSGRSDFGALVGALEAGKSPFTCFAFDILTHDGKDQRQLALKARKQLLKKLLAGAAKAGALQYSDDFAGNGAAVLKTACAHGLEGIIAKRADRPYRAGRSEDWVKIKCGHAQEFIVIGFAPSAKRRAFSSLLLAVLQGETLRYAGRVGGGFSEASLQHLAQWRDAHRTRLAACDVPAPMRRNVVWVAPDLTVQIEFAGWTPDGLVRQGRFTGIREDKPAREVKAEIPKPTAKSAARSKPSPAEISHPDKLLYPQDGVTKGDIACYIQTAAPFMLPYIKNRFVSLIRSPDGVGKKSFFQRHPSPGFGADWLAQEFTNHDRKTETYIYFEKPAALLSAVQLSTLEFHIWGSRRDQIDKPDRIVFDLDPDPSVDFAAVKEAAFRLRDVLQVLGLESLPLLSGGKGIHVVVPVQRQHAFPVIKKFSADLANRLTADRPAKFVATMSKAKRSGKIFIDHFRNELGATAIAPYSPRARPGAAVAWPVDWAGLANIKAADAVSMAKAKALLESGENGWAGYAEISQRLTQAAIRAVAT